MIDPDFAKDQLLLLMREWYMHPNGQIPRTSGRSATSTAGARVGRDPRLPDRRQDVWPQRPRVPRAHFQKLLLNFTWWVNRKDAEGNNIFEGGFLGLDNIGASTGRRVAVGGRSSRRTARAGWRRIA
jgi:hypothetical protein